MSNKCYDTLKLIQLVLPLLATFYVAICAIWGLPYGDEVANTAIALEALISGVIKVASEIYNRKIADDESEESEDA